MRDLAPDARLCERARAWQSLRLDGDLSELESMLLEAHVDDCAPCRAFVGDTAALTAALRAAPLEPLDLPVAVPRTPRRLLAPLRFGAAAAAAAAAVLAVTVSVPLETTGGTFEIAAAGSTSAFNVDRDLRQIRRWDLAPPEPLRIVRRGLALPPTGR